MANPRAEIPIVVLSESNPTFPISGASATVKKRGGAAATVYTDAGATEGTATQPLTTDATGKITGWLERGAYEVSVTIPGKSAYTEYLDIAPGSDGSVDTAWLADGSVTGAKVASAIKDAAAGTASLRTLGTGATQATSGTDGRLSDTRTPTDGSVTTAKLADGSVTAAKFAAGSGFVPTGTILAWAGGSAPTGFLLANGESKAKASFEALWNVIEYTYGGAGSSFNLPDLIGRVPVGQDSAGLRIASNVIRGQSGGNFYLQSHTHGAGSYSTLEGIRSPQQTVLNNFNNYSAASGFLAIAGWSLSTVTAIAGTSSFEGLGSGQNMPPYLITNYIIKT